MQLKKTPRDDRFPGTARPHYEEEPMADEAGTMDYASDQQVTRSARRPELEGEVAARNGVRASSVVDAHSTFDGRYETDQDLRIEGSISGEVLCRGLLTVERDATVRAKIEAHDAEVRGRLEGDIVCTGRLLLTSTAVVIGTMTSGSLVVEEGASVSGKVETSSLAGASKAAAAATTPANRAANGAQSNGAEPPTGQATRNRREVPSFALVSSDDRTSLDRN